MTEGEGGWRVEGEEKVERGTEGGKRREKGGKKEGEGERRKKK
jgi:hypothetical protein